MTLSGIAGILGCCAAKPAASTNKRAPAWWKQSIERPVCRNARRIASLDYYGVARGEFGCEARTPRQEDRKDGSTKAIACQFTAGSSRRRYPLPANTHR